VEAVGTPTPSSSSSAVILAASSPVASARPVASTTDASLLRATLGRLRTVFQAQASMNSSRV
jgi:hypothetical protein